MPRRTLGNTIQAAGLGYLFFALPLELQVQVLKATTLCDLLNLRQTSRQFRSLILQNEQFLCITYIATTVPEHMISLYPVPANPSFTYLSYLAHTQNVSIALATTLTTQIMKEMIGRRHTAKMDPLLRERIVSRLRRG